MAIKSKKKGNPIARSLLSNKFKQKIVKPKKGKGSFKRLKSWVFLKRFYNLAPICWIALDDISVPFSRLSFKDILLM